MFRFFTRPLATGVVVSALVLLIVAPAGAASPRERAQQRLDLARAKAATAIYHRVDAAERDGYAQPPDGVPLHECISALEGPGAMGFHWLNSTLVSDAVLDTQQPEALVYEPTRNGRLRLVAAEYVVFADAWQDAHPGTTPRLFGQDLTFVPAPNRFEIPAFYQIHAWLWKANPNGTFADFNPRVSCEDAGTASPRERAQT